MTVVDSSVLIDFLAGREYSQTAWLKQQSKSTVCLPDLVVFEVLQGIRHPEAFTRVRADLLSFAVAQTVNVDTSIAAARNYRLLRERGITIRSSVDVLIATFCLANGYALLHRDRDYDYFERELGLKVVKISLSALLESTAQQDERMNRRSLLRGGIAALTIAELAKAQEASQGLSLAEGTARVIALVRQIRPGDLRKSLESHWRTDGGMQVPSPVRYVLKACGNIQISVEFRRVDLTEPFDNPDDIITHVSKPYLESPAYD